MIPARSSYVTSTMEFPGRSQRETRGLYNRSQERGNPTRGRSRPLVSSKVRGQGYLLP